MVPGDFEELLFRASSWGLERRGRERASGLYRLVRGADGSITGCPRQILWASPSLLSSTPIRSTPDGLPHHPQLRAGDALIPKSTAKAGRRSTRARRAAGVLLLALQVGTTGHLHGDPSVSGCTGKSRGGHSSRSSALTDAAGLARASGAAGGAITVGSMYLMDLLRLCG
jgi:hypothetical protein